MARRRKGKVIGKKFHALIGQIVVEFGQLEHRLRESISDMVCPAIRWPLNNALFARTRFAELVDLYEFVFLAALDCCEENEKLTPGEKDKVTNELKDLRRDLAGISERRNAVVHSAYQEIDYGTTDDCSELELEAFRPFLHRRAHDESLPFGTKSEDEITKELPKLITDIQTVSASFNAFDYRSSRYVNYLWEWHCTWFTLPEPIPRIGWWYPAQTQSH